MNELATALRGAMTSKLVFLLLLLGMASDFRATASELGAARCKVGMLREAEPRQIRPGSPADGADVTGIVRFPDGRPAGNAVVSLDGGPAGTPLSNAMVDQRHKTFIPHVSVVTRGTTVQFPNNDTVFHNVFAYYQAKKFDLGMYPRGATRSVTFDKPGVVVLFCSIHTDMNAYIMVVDTPYYAVTDGQGRFRIPHVAAGHYSLHGWQESGVTANDPVTIGTEPATFSVDLTKRP
ncbi:MAG: hypothetical protein ACLQVD_07690 [Capsulimonadaceae bacterium]